MAGKRTHHLPRMLQKGFASHFTNKGAAYAWWYRRSEKPINLNTINIGVESGFYSVGEEPTLDDSMTAFETKTESMIAGLRDGPPREVTGTRLVAEYIAHLELRTFHLRQSMMNLGSVAVQMILSFLDNEANFAAWIQRSLKANPALLGDPVSIEAKKRGLEAPDPKQLIDTLEPHLGALTKQIWPNVAQRHDAIRAMLPELMRNASKNSQLKALSSGMSPPAKVEIYEKLSYRLIDTNTPLILGDSGLLFQVAAEKPFRTFSSTDYPLVAVLLPLATNRLLVGSATSFEPDLESLPLAIARCSLDCFIASSATVRNAQLATEIGTCTELMSQEEMAVIFNEVMAT